MAPLWWVVKFSIWFQWGQEEDTLEGKRDVPFKRLLLELLEDDVPQTLNNKVQVFIVNLFASD